jgi:ribosomal protein L32
LTGNFHFAHTAPVALSSCPECGKELSDTALNCPHCGWHKSRVGMVVAVIAAVAVLVIGALFYYQISEADKAHANLRKELNKPVEIQKKLAP